MRTVLYLLCGLLTVGASTASSAQQKLSAGGQGKRFMYTLSCQGRLYKFSALTGQYLEETDLSQKIGRIHRDDCAISGAVYAPDDNAFFILEKKGEPSQKGTYAVLSFRLSDSRFQYAMTLPEQFDGQETPHLELSAAGPPQVVTRTKTYGVAKDRLVTKSKVEEPLIAGSREVKGNSGILEMDLTGYTVSGLNVDSQGPLLYRPLSNSGSVVLIQYKRLIADPGYAGYAVVNLSARKIVGLNPGFATSESDFPILAPGGTSVLFQEYKDGNGTERLALLDTSTGSVVLPLEDKSMEHGGVWAITPSGIALFSSCCLNNSSLLFHQISLGRDFSTLPMLDHGRNGKNWYFFSER